MTPPAAVTLADLPHDMLREIAERLPRPSIGALALSCKAARDALVGRPSLLWRAVTCTAAFLASNDPAAGMLRTRAAEVKNMGLRAATPRVLPTLRLFTSLESIVMGLLSAEDGDRLLNAVAAASPRLATAKLAFPVPLMAVISKNDGYIINAPHLKRLVLVGQSELNHVQLLLGKWNTPDLETIEFEGIIPSVHTDFEASEASNLRAEIAADPEVVATKRAYAAAIAAGVGVEEAETAAMHAFIFASNRLKVKRVQDCVAAGKSVVHAPPRLRKVVVRYGVVKGTVQPVMRTALSALEAEGVEVVYV